MKVVDIRKKKGVPSALKKLAKKHGVRMSYKSKSGKRVQKSLSRLESDIKKAIKRHSKKSKVSKKTRKGTKKTRRSRRKSSKKTRFGDVLIAPFGPPTTSWEIADKPAPPSSSAFGRRSRFGRLNRFGMLNDDKLVNSALYEATWDGGVPIPRPPSWNPYLRADGALIPTGINSPKLKNVRNSPLRFGNYRQIVL